MSLARDFPNYNPYSKSPPKFKKDVKEYLFDLDSHIQKVLPNSKKMSKNIYLI